MNTLQVDSSDRDEATLAGGLREAMVDELRELGVVRSERVAEALRTVPRHLFAPGEPLERAYATMTILQPKRDERDVVVSMVSASDIQAMMLEQAEIEPGMRVLEIGSGGYNAALIAELVGQAGEITTMDIDPDIVGRARGFLASAGYDRVNVVLGDAENGVPDRGPFDRVIVTAGAWDIPPAWTEQLGDGGWMVVPLRLRGLTRSVVFERDRDRLASRDYRLCGFVPMQGIGAHPERTVLLDEDRVVLRTDGEQPVDAARIRAALFGPRVERWSGVEVGGTEPFDDLDLWVATVVDGFGLLTAAPEAIDSGMVAASARSGGAKTVIAGESFAYRASARPVDTQRTRFEFGAYAHGPHADRLADEYVELIRDWDRNLRGGPRAHIGVYHAATPDADLPAGRVIDKGHTRVVISWPGRRARQR